MSRTVTLVLILGFWAVFPVNTVQAQEDGGGAGIAGADLLITGFEPAQGGPGDIVTINGEGFGAEALNLSVSVENAGVSIPLEVVSASNSLLRCRLGPVPPQAVAGEILVELGSGNEIPAEVGGQGGGSVWGSGPQANVRARSRTQFTPVPADPPAGTVWSFGGPSVEGDLCVTIDGNWNDGEEVQLLVRYRDARGVGRDLNMSFRTRGASLDACAELICQQIKRVLAVDCQVSVVRDGVLKLTVSAEEGIRAGAFTVCRNAPPPPALEITGFSPRRGAPGTVVTVTGSGFGNDPDDLCMVVMSGPETAIPLDVQSINADGTSVQAVLGPVPPLPDGKPVPDGGAIMVGLGQGGRGTFIPNFPGVVLLEPVWVWDRLPADGPVAQTVDEFVPLPVPEPPNVRWFFGEPSDGTFCLFLDGDWIAGSVLEIHARAHDHTKGIGHDLRVPRIRLDGGGSTLDCAERICDIVKSAFQQQAGIDVNCDILPQEDGRIKIVLSLEGCRIDWGNFNVCVSPPPEEGGIAIDDVQPRAIAEGETLTIDGSFPDVKQEDICVAVLNGRVLIPFPVTAFEDVDKDGVAEIQAIPPPCMEWEPGPILVTFGRGVREGGVFAWRALPESPQALSEQIVSPVLVKPVEGMECRTGTFETEIVSMDLRGTTTWHPETQLTALVKVSKGPEAPGSGRFIHLEQGLSIRENHAEEICKAMSDALALVEDVDVDGLVCDAFDAENEDGVPVLRVQIQAAPGTPPLAFGGGVICLTPAPRTDPVIDDFSPSEGGAGTRIAIKGAGFGNDPDALCVLVRDPEGHVITQIDVLQVSPNEIIGELGVLWIDGHEGHLGTIEVYFGRGGRLGPGAPFIWQMSPTLPLPPPAVSTDLFETLPPQEPNVGCFGTVTPVDGQLRLRIDGSWAPDTNVELLLKAFDREAGRGLAMRADTTRLGDGSALDCAQSICDAILASFEAQGIEVLCAAAEAGEDSAVISFGMPGARIGSGKFYVCADPIPVDPPRMVIDDVEPKRVTTGDLVTIIGRGFGDDPDDLCILMVNPDLAGPLTGVPVRAIEASDGRVVGRVGVVPETDGKPPACFFMMSRGNGVSAANPRVDLEPDGIFGAETWSWAPLPDSPTARSANGFVAVPSPPPANVRWYTGDAGDTEICLTLPDRWCPKAKVSITGRLLSTTAEDGSRKGYDFQHDGFQFEVPEGASARECAELICNIIKRQCERFFAEHPGRRAVVSCVVSEEDGLTKITARLFDETGKRCPLQISYLSVCVECPPEVVVDDVLVDDVIEGEEFKIQGDGFGEDPDDISISGLVGGGIHLRAIAAANGELTARAGPVVGARGKPFEKPGPIMVVRGDGESRSIAPAEFVSDKPVDFKPVPLLEPLDVWAWVGDDRNASFSKPVDFRTEALAGDGGGAGIPIEFCVFGSRSEGKFKMRIFGDWPSGTVATIYARFTGESGRAYHMEATRAVLGGGSPARTAQRIVGIMQTSFLLLHGLILFGVVEELPDGSAELTISILNDPIERGFLITCGTFGSGSSGVIPGDCNSDGRIDLSDPVCLLGFLFLGRPNELPCGDPGGAEPDAGDISLLDSDGSGDLDLTDPVRMLAFLFLGGPPHVGGTDCVEIPGCDDVCIP